MAIQFSNDDQESQNHNSLAQLVLQFKSLDV